MRISAIIIAKTEEKRIAKAIASISFVGEIIVIDNDSNDSTKKISESLGAKVFSFSGDNFSDCRNFGLEKSTGEWILYIDADEIVTDELMQNINFVIQSENLISTYKIKRKNFYLGNNEWPRIEIMERLFRRKFLKKWVGVLHESPIFEGNIAILDGFLLHYSHRNLSEMLVKTLEWSQKEAKLRYDANHPQMKWWRFPRVMIPAFYKSYISQGGWRVGSVGLIESIYQSFSIFITYAKLWELQEKHGVEK